MRYQDLFESPTVTLGNNTIPFTLSRQSIAIGERLVKIDVRKIDQAWQKDHDFYIGTNGVGGIRGRYERFADFVNSTQEPIEASEIYVRENGDVTFTNGRHRFAYFRDRGVAVMPVAMHPDAIENARKYGYLV